MGCFSQEGIQQSSAHSNAMHMPATTCPSHCHLNALNNVGHYLWQSALNITCFVEVPTIQKSEHFCGLLHHSVSNTKPVRNIFSFILYTN